MANFEGFQSKYERGEHFEMSKASLVELEALEKKYSSVLEGGEYAFSWKPSEEGYRIFSRLLEAVRAKISEAKAANASVSEESATFRKNLSKEVRKPVKKPVENRTSEAKAKESAREEAVRRDQAPEFVKIPLAPEPKSPTPTGVKKSDLDGFAWGVRSALKDMGKAVSGNAGTKNP